MNGTLSAAEARAVMARHGRSFSWASRLLAGSDAEAASRLYAFCRSIDDLADESGPEEGTRRLDALRAEIERGESDDPAVRAYFALEKSSGISREVALRFVDAVAGDLGRVRVADEGELVRYGYGVASTVGLMMCSVLGVRDSRALPFAIDLGVGMQLTNIARDVLEDAGLDRRYVPAAYLPRAVEPQEIRAADARLRGELLCAVYRILDLADRFYRSADRGMRFLPWRARLAILTASRVYEAIGTEIRRRGDRYWEGRVVVGRTRKLWHTARAIGSLLFDPGYWNLGAAPRHPARLHRALRRLPGANPAA